MKTIKILFALTFILFLNQHCSAQYGNGGMNGGYGGMGNGAMMNRQPQKDEKEIEKNRQKRIDELVNKLKTELVLDDLQIFAVRKQIEDSEKSVFTVWSKKELSDEDKIKEIEAINNKSDNTIFTYLNPQQREKYKKIIEERKERMEKYKAGR